MSQRESLTSRVRTLCANFSTASPLPTLLSNFTKTPPPTALEHGLPQLAPFLGRPFTGHEGLTTYFGLLADYLTIEQMDFEPEDNWVVDERAMAVSLRGKARFKWKETGQAWDETFAYRIELKEELGEVKVVVYEVWADTGAAYLARVGGLEGGV
ncbi:uncharacterized protein BDW43DRAFT_229575 [Aspergillus alliaceus]|uniref:uncharacterized protein n=1 Tax=Petromyces alliaceus TaxID=209559 RepID=UPI0012A70678|nr:uncharacterized protein BDW43DRAFT_229575 [Aspergillus alliaceus]KAB8237049.1 hypothetical protein BDW43DRAFT_229575 [Aspergillus alliaceus]